MKATQAVEAGRAQGKAVGTIPGLGNSSRYSPMIEGRVVGLASSEKRRRMTKADI